MKTTLLLTFTTVCAFLGTYFLELTADNFEQFLAIVSVVLLDGFFGVWAGTKKEGFQTRKALKVLKTLVGWVVILAVVDRKSTV